MKMVVCVSPRAEDYDETIVSLLHKHTYVCTIMYVAHVRTHGCMYSKISIIRTMIIRISLLIQTLMNVRFLM